MVNLSLRKSYSQFSLLTSLRFLVKKQKGLRPNQDNKFKLISLSILITYLLDKVFKFQKEFTFLSENSRIKSNGASRSTLDFNKYQTFWKCQGNSKNFGEGVTSDEPASHLWERGSFLVALCKKLGKASVAWGIIESKEKTHKGFGILRTWEANS